MVFSRLLSPGIFLLSTTLPLQAAQPFVTRQGTRLMLDGKPFRFAGGNLDYLALASDSFGKIGATDMYYPSKFMIDDAFATLNKMNGVVTRIWSSASQGCALCIEPERGKFNETALRQLDYIVYSAGQHHIRLILLFVDPWGYYTGGIVQYQKWRGGGDFFRDPALIGDYKEYVATLIHRKNSYTGVAYRDDPTILAWQPGNELRDASLEWERDVARFIKSLDPNHLIISGDDTHGIEGDRAAIPEVDILSRHYYPYFAVNHVDSYFGVIKADPEKLWNLERDRDRARRANKVFVVDEFGWDRENGSVEQLKAHLNTILADPDIAGDLFWALRGRKDNGDFMAVPGADGDWWALYYPGRKTPLNSEADMRLRVRILGEHATAMSGVRPRTPTQ
jgi:mannan endo-1,4-beta-mannosidase